MFIAVREKVSVLALCILLTLWSGLAYCGSEVLDQGIMDSLKANFGLDAEGVISRLAAEEVAYDKRDLALEALGDSYGGAWFNEDSWELEVAAVSGSRAELAMRLGLNVILVERSLRELEAIKLEISKNAFSHNGWKDIFLSAGIDVQNNSILVGIRSEHTDYAQENLHTLAANVEAIRLQARDRTPAISSSIRGGNPYVNQEPPLYPYTCSIGFSTVLGFFTAGHCNYSDDPVEDIYGNPMGQFIRDEWPDSDYALVEVNSAWSTTYQVNGYTDGIVDIPADFGGYRIPLTNTTVCRSGQQTKGLHCGTVQIVDDGQTFETIYDGDVYLDGIVKTNVCQQGGDSGGPFILAGSNLAQGTLIGGWSTPCPGTGDGAWFEPIEKHMMGLPDEVKTPHGSNAPDIVNPICPDTSLQAAGQYVCVTDYDSQGLTSVSWDSSVPGQSGTSPYFIGFCTPGYWVTVDLEVVNNHGFDSQSFGFTCPSSP